jgi:hypothetical protein
MTNKNDPGQKLLELSRRAMAKSALIPVSLPVWPETKRATPNAFLRSALFSAIQSKDRKFLDRAVLGGQEGITVRFTGKQLNQEDLTLWETLVHLAKVQPLGNICEFTAYDILKTLGFGDSGKEREILHEGIIRLGACMVEILIDNKNTYFSSLIDHGAKNEETGYYRIQLSKSLIKLYAQNTWIDFEQRAKLQRKPLAQYLHGYYSSHKVPFSIKIETLHKFSGSRNKRLSDFKQKTIIALNELVKIGFLESYSIDDDKVVVKKK